MDYKRNIINILFILSLLALITACGGPNEEITIGSIKTSPEPLRIIGTPPDVMYYDSPFEFEFGAAGGDGKYRYRYIANPVSDTGEKLNEDDNPVELSIEVLDAAKPLFRLKGIPVLPEDISFSELNNRNFTYQVELTDGQNTITRDFEFTLKKNKLQLVSLPASQEGRVTDSFSRNLVEQLGFGQKRVCKQVLDRTFEKRITENGEVVFPYVFQAFTDEKVASRTELFYRFRSSYSELESERSDRNVGHLRPNVDYIDRVGSIILEPGNTTCIGYLEIFNDEIIEGDEEFRIEFFDRIGGAVDFNTASGNLTLRDDELLPKYETKNIVRNKGEKVVVPIRNVITKPTPVNIAVFSESDKTTATNEDYSIEPTSGIVTINANELESAYTVSLNSSASTDVSSTYKDKLISIKTDIDKILDVKPYTIEINEWPRGNLIANEIVAAESANEEAINFTIDGDGVLTTLNKLTGSSNIRTRLKTFTRDATPFQMTDTQMNIDLGSPGVNVTPRAINSMSAADIHTLVVVVNVDGLYANTYRGGEDFAVLIFKRNREAKFILESAMQYGTEGDDIVSNAIIRNNTLYVYGKTNGQNFEGVASNETNSGGEDGFIYAIDPLVNSYRWSRFIGTPDNDNVKDIDAGNRDIVALVSTFNSDEDAYIKKLSARTSLDLPEERTIRFATPRADKAASVRFDATANNFRALLNSSALLSESNTPTPSLSQDPQLLVFDTENNSSGSFTMNTSNDDEAVSFENMPDKQHFVIGGNTEGVFPDNQKRGANTQDAFVTIFESKAQTTAKILKTIQFGTSGNDRLISLKPVSNTKFFVLWEEDSTSSPNKVYRISAFSIDGRKLSRDPD